MYIWSEKTKSFYPVSEKEVFEKNNMWPDDGVEISEEEHTALFQEIPVDHYLGLSKGKLTWLPVDATSDENTIRVNNAKKESLIQQMNDVLTRQQLPAKAALGRLTEKEQKNYNIFLDYFDALEQVDLSKPQWPEVPSL